MKISEVIKTIITGILGTAAILSFIIFTTADSEVPFRYWFGMVGIFLSCSILLILITNPYPIMSVIMPASVCVGAFIYDKLHIHSKQLRKCYRIKRYSGSYSKCYSRCVQEYEKYVEDKQNEKYIDDQENDIWQE